MSEWKKYKICEIAEVMGGGTPSTSVGSFWNGDIPWLTPRDLTGYNKTYISRGERNISNEGLKNSSSKIIPKGSVLLTSRAPIGYVAIAQNELCTNQGFKSLIPNIELASSEYLYYWVKNNSEYLQSIGTGTTFLEISSSVVKDIDIQLPSPPEQKAIAAVLSSLDDKIDLLRRQNKTLEAMAETLFRQWFVEEAREDWEVGTVNDIVSVKGGTTPSTKQHEYWDGNIYWTTPRDLSSHNAVFLFDTERKITQQGLAQIGSGLLPLGTVLLSSRAPIGYLVPDRKPLVFQNIG